MDKKKYKIQYTFEPSFKSNEVSEIDVAGLSILYTNDWYDGPLEGICEWKGEKYYFLLRDYEPRTYYLIKLLPLQLQNDEKLHLDYLRLIESYPYITEGAISHRKDAKWDIFHEECEKYDDQTIQQEQVLGWFHFNSDMLKNSNITKDN